MAFGRQCPATRNRKPGRANNPIHLQTDEQADLYRQSAKQILQRSGQSDGYCLVLGTVSGGLAYELAKQSNLTVYAVDPDAESARKLQDKFQQAGLHGIPNHGRQRATG